MKMSKRKTKADAPVEVRDAVKHGLNGFDDKAVADSIITAHEQSLIADTAADAKAAAAYSVCMVAAELRNSKDNANIADEAFQSGWRYSLKGIYLRLHAAGVSWVERTESKDADGNQTVAYKLTKYGRNISSNAQQGAILLTLEEVKAAETLQGLRKAIRDRKAELATEALTENQVLCAEAADDLQTVFDAIMAELAEIESVEAYAEVGERMLPIMEYVALGSEETEETEETTETVEAETA
jgi:hypothetical protein